MNANHSPLERIYDALLKLPDTAGFPLDPGDGLYCGATHKSWAKPLLDSMFARLTVPFDRAGVFLSQEKDFLTVTATSAPALNSKGLPGIKASAPEIRLTMDGEAVCLRLAMDIVSADADAVDLMSVNQNPSAFCIAFKEWGATDFSVLEMAGERLVMNGGPKVENAAAVLFAKFPGAPSCLGPTLPGGLVHACWVKNFQDLPGARSPALEYVLAGNVALGGDAKNGTFPKATYRSNLLATMFFTSDKLTLGQCSLLVKMDKGDKYAPLVSAFSAESKTVINHKDAIFSSEFSPGYDPLEYGEEDGMTFAMKMEEEDVLTPVDIAAVAMDKTWADDLSGPGKTIFASFGLTQFFVAIDFSDGDFFRNFTANPPKRLDAVAATLKTAKPFQIKFPGGFTVSSKLGLNWRYDFARGEDKPARSEASIFMEAELREKETAWGDMRLFLNDSLAGTGLIALRNSEGLGLATILGKLAPGLATQSWLEFLNSILLQSVFIRVDPGTGTFGVELKANFDFPFLNFKMTDAKAKLDTWLDTDKKRQLTGSLSGLVRLGDVSVMLQGERGTDNWLLQAGTPSGMELTVSGFLSSLMGVKLDAKRFDIVVYDVHLLYFKRDEKKNADTWAKRVEIGGSARITCTMPGLNAKLQAKLLGKREQKADANAAETKSLDLQSRLDLEIACLPKLSLGLNVIYRESDEKEIKTAFFWEGLKVEWTKDENSEGSSIVASIGDDAWKLGRILKKILGLVGLASGDGDLDDPWTLLNDIAIRNVSLRIKVDAKGELGDLKLEQEKLGWNVYFGTINGVKMAYNGAKVSMEVKGSFPVLGADKTLPFDIWCRDETELIAANGDKKIPGSAFVLKTLFAGSRIAILAPDKRVDSISSALKDIRKNLLDPTYKPAYDGNCGWIFGLDCAIADDLLHLGLLFCDPSLYGLHIEVGGKGDFFLKGLEFDILYQKLSDSLGVFRAQLTLPDKIRRLDFGAVAITLPNLALDIFTNGEFKADLGFPWNNDFSRSGMLTYTIFTGGGGVYFGILGSDTSTALPSFDAKKGMFKPVVELGVGIYFFVGLDKVYGPLAIKVGLGASAIVEGCYAQWNPATQGDKSVYFRCSGILSIFGAISCRLDIKVISFEFSVSVRLSAMFALETNRQSMVAIKAELDAAVKIRILFFSINFTFHFTFTYQLAFGRTSPSPWELDANSENGLSFPAPERMKAIHRNFLPLAPNGAKTEVVLGFCPQPIGGTEAMLCLFAPAANGADDAGSLDAILKNVCWWYLAAFAEGMKEGVTLTEAGELKLGAADMAGARRLLEEKQYDNSGCGLTNAALVAALDSLFDFSFKAVEAEKDLLDENGIDRGRYPFPMPADAVMEVTKTGGEEPFLRVDFAKSGMLSSDAIAAWRKRLAPLFPEGMESDAFETGDEAETPLAAIMFFAAFTAGLWELVSKIPSWDGDEKRSIRDIWGETAGNLPGALGVFSSSVYSGQRAPTPEGAGEVPVFTRTRQQFELGAAAAGSISVRLSRALSVRDAAPPVSVMGSWNLSFDAVEDRLTATAGGLNWSKLDTFFLPEIRTVPRRFLLSNPTNVAKGKNNYHIHKIPLECGEAIARSAARLRFRLMEAVDSDHGGRNGLDGVNLGGEDAPTAQDWRWMQSLDFDIHRLPEAPGVPVFKVAGLDDAEVRVLERVLADDAEWSRVETVFLFWNALSGGLDAGPGVEDDIGCFRLVRLDCEEETKPFERMQQSGVNLSENASFGSPREFCAMMLEAGRVRASGIYLYYRSGDSRKLPEGLFDELGKAKITLGIVYKRAEGDSREAPAMVNRVLVANAGTESNLYLEAAANTVSIAVDGGASLLRTAKENNVRWIDLVGAVAELPLANTDAVGVAAGMNRQAHDVRNLSDLARVSGRKTADFAAELRDMPLSFEAGARATVEAGLFEVKAELPQGTVGMRIVSKEDANLDVDNNLLDWRLPESGVYSPPCEPMLPPIRQAVVGGGWQYQFTVSAAALASQNLPWVDPYACVGKPLLLALDWRDAFGNLTVGGGKTFTTTPLFTDDVAGISTWPATLVAHSFSGGGVRGKALITVSFDADYAPGNEQMQADLKQFRRVFCQLRHSVGEGNAAQKTLSAKISVSFDASTVSGVAVDTAPLELYAEEAIKHIESLLEGSRSAVKPPAPVTLAVAVTAPKTVLECVKVSLTFERDQALVPMEILDDPLKLRSIMDIPPAFLTQSREMTAEAGGAGQEYEKSFANAFNAGDFAFRLATGVTQVGGEKREEVWAVRTSLRAGVDESLYVTLDDAGSAVFGPRPLSTSLLSRNGMESWTYDPRTGAMTQSGTRNCLDVDLDAWLDSALGMVDSCLTPRIGAAARLTNATSELLEDIRKGKKELAASLTGALASVRKDDPDQPGEGTRLRFRETLGRQLFNYARTPVVVEMGLSVGLKSGDWPTLGLYGRPAGLAAGSGRQPALSHFKVMAKSSAAIGGLNAALAVSMDAPEETSSLSLQKKLIITHLEPDPSTAPRRPLAWLKLMTPWGVGDDVGFEVPIPLRRYPEKPQLLEQGSEPDARPEGGLSALGRWRYFFTYARQPAMQDTLSAEICIIDDEPEKMAVRDDGRDLFHGLNRLQQVLPAIRNALLAAVSADLAGAEGVNAELENGLKALKTLLHELAEQIRAWFAPRKSLERNLKVGKKLCLSLSEHDDSGDYALGLAIDGREGEGADELVPVPQIPGYKAVDVSGRWKFRDANGQFLTAAAARLLLRRRLAVSGLSIMTDTMVKTSAKVYRNRDISSSGAINSLFIYETVRVEYDGVFVPRHEYGQEICVAPTRMRLDACLDKVLGILFRGGAVRNVDCQIDIVGSKRLFAEAPDVMLEYPVVLAAFRENDKKLRDKVVHAVQEWRRESGAADGTLSMRVRLSTRREKGSFGTPLVVYNRLTVDLANIED